ncbi:MAG: hypothetical protein KAJ18_12135 [Candidatus Omnitrophica bacterium]|nr:hypothetical protein [Candidatus Omnitrophota bacterium]
MPNKKASFRTVDKNGNVSRVTFPIKKEKNLRNTGNYKIIQLYRFCYFCGSVIALKKNDQNHCCSDECNEKNKREKLIFNVRLKNSKDWRELYG